MTTLNTLLLLGPLGVQELLVILLIILVIFGSSKLPQLGRGLGEGISNFKKGLKSDAQKIEKAASKSADDSAPST